MSTNSIKYQVLTPEYVESAIQCSIACKTYPGNTYQNFKIPLEDIEKLVRSQFTSDASYKFTIIAIDKSIGNKVVGLIQGMDIMDYDKLIITETSHRSLNVLAKLSIRLTEDVRSQVKQYGDLVFGFSIGFLPQYRNQQMSLQLIKYFVFRIYELGYKQFIGLSSNPQMQYLFDKHSVSIVRTLYPDDCLDLDPNIREYIKGKYVCAIYFFDESASLAKRYSKQKQYFLEQVKPHL